MKLKLSPAILTGTAMHETLLAEKPVAGMRIKKRKAKKLSYRAKRKIRNKRAAQARKLNCK